MLADPFSDINPFKRDPSDAIEANAPKILKRPTPGAKFPGLKPGDADPMKDSLLHRSLSGLHYVGSTLDKAFGGRAVRGALTGKMDELASVIPFSDTLGITDYEHRNTTGGDVLKHFGYDPSKGNWAERNLAGPAAEIALDPGTYLSFGGKHAATALGRMAHGLGETKGWTHQQLLQGFTHTEPELMNHLASTGRSAIDAAGDVAHMRNQGSRIASTDLVNHALAMGDEIKAGAPLAGVAGVGLPFRPAAFTLGHGGTSQRLAGVGDAVGDLVKHMPVVRNARALFDTNAMRSDHAGVQRSAELLGKSSREEIESQVRAAEYHLRGKFDGVVDAAGHLPGAESEAARVIRGSAENAAQFRDPATWMADYQRRVAAGLVPHATDHAAVGAHVAGHYGTLRQLGREVGDFGNFVADHGDHLGLKLRNLNDEFADYAARRYIGASPSFQGSPESRLFQVQHGSNLARKSGLTEIPGGTEQINEWAMNPALSGARMGDEASRLAVVQQDMIRNRMLENGGLPLGHAEMSSVRGKSQQVVRWLNSVNHAHAEHGIPYFNPDLIGDLAMRGMRHAKVVGAARVLAHGAASMSRPASEFAMGSGHVPLGDFLSSKGQAGLTTTLDWQKLNPAELAHVQLHFPDPQDARNVLSNPSIFSPAEQAAAGRIDPAVAAKLMHQQWNGAGVRAYEHMAQAHGFGDVRQAIDGHVNPIQSLNQYGLSADDAGALSRFMAGWTTPGEAQPFLKWMDGAQTFFKNMVYPLWPASHVRNLTSALYNNWVHGTPLAAYHDAHALLNGRGIDHLAYGASHAPLTPIQRAEALKRGAYADGKVFSGINSFQETVGARGLQDEALHNALAGQGRLIPRTPGTGHATPIGDVLTAPGAWNPFNQQGVGGGPLDRLLRGKDAVARTEDTFAPLVLGRRVGTHIEDFVRLANYLGNLRKGMDSARAGQHTRALHFDYTDLTPGEKALKSVIPFYTYMRKNLPMQVEQAFTRPSAVSPMLHALAGASGGEWLPQHLASGVAIPVGGEDEGTRRYLNKLGLPFEEAFERLKFREGTLPGGHKVSLPDVGQTALAFAGSLNPYIKGPLEHMTNTQFHTGRKLTDLHAKGLAGGYGLLPEEYAQPLSQLVANSPLARVVSTVDRLGDDRKGWPVRLGNLLTGVKLTDVDMEKARAIAGRSELKEILHANPLLGEFTNFYVRPEHKGPLPEELAKQLRLLTTFNADAKAHHKAQEAAERLRQVQALNALNPGL